MHEKEVYDSNVQPVSLLACATCSGAMGGTYDLQLVGLSYLIAVLASYNALDLGRRVATAEGLARRVWLGTGASMMGIGIWAMHFVGMQAFKMSMPVTYDVTETALSMLVAIFASGLALYTVGTLRVPRARLLVGGVLMGVAILAMHYIGMSGMRMPASITYDPAWFAASVMIAIGGSLAALWVTALLHQPRAHQRYLKLGAAVVMGFAITGMHYTGMAAAIFTPTKTNWLGDGVRITDLGAYAIGVATLAGLCLTLLSSVVDLERQRSQRTIVFLAESAARLSKSLDPVTTLETLAQLAVPRHAEACAIDLLDETRQSLRRSVAMVEGEDGRAPHGRSLTLDVSGRHPAAIAVATNRPVLLPELTGLDVESLSGDGALTAWASRSRAHALISVPLRVRGDAVGAMTWLLSNTARQYTAAEVTIAEELAHRASSALENARLYQEAQEAIRARDEFLSIASHELKTPLTPLSLQLEMVRRALSDADDASIRHIAEKVAVAQKQQQKLTRLVSELLDISRIRTGRLELDRRPTDLSRLTAEIVTRLQPELTQNGTPVQLRVEEGVTGDWDALRIDQVLTNLITNASKYGNRKSIEVVVRRQGASAEILVTDFGIGISPEHQQRIFERFERAASRNYGGLGLGLYIARQIVEAHHGEIRVHSTLNGGSTFSVALPLAAEVSSTWDVPLQ